MEAFEARCGGVDFNDDFVGHLYDLRTCSDTGTWYANECQHFIVQNLDSSLLLPCQPCCFKGGQCLHATIVCDRARLYNCDVQPIVLLVLGVIAIHQVNREHAKMFIEEVDVAIIDAFGDLLANLMRRPPLDHVESRPSVLGLRPT
jgi:hypothetical protein